MPRKGTHLSPEAAERQKQSIREWQKKNTESLNIRVRREKADEYRALAQRMGKPLATIIKGYLDGLLEENPKIT